MVTTFGKPTAQPYDKPGAYFKWPWPIQKVYKFDQRVHLMIKKDGKLIDKVLRPTLFVPMTGKAQREAGAGGAKP